MRPFLKWAGGKRQLLPFIMPYIEDYIKTESTFFEPFVGGGAIFLELQHQNVHINDLNSELINCYDVIKKQPYSLIEKLKDHRNNHDKDYFYKIRREDRNNKIFRSMSDVERAARIIYLNKTCYNGLYRVNQKGQFNTPIGKYTNPKIFDEKNILEISKYLNENQVKITSNTFDDAVKTASKGDFVYFDPPYDYTEQGFTTYTENGFDQYDLGRLKDCSDKLIRKGCYVLISNNATERVLNLFDNPDYEIITISYDIKKISANRNINSKASARKKVEEVLIFGKRNEKVSTSKFD